MKNLRTPRVIVALHELINIKGYIMDIALRHVPHITLPEALPNFTWSRHSYHWRLEYLRLCRIQAGILQQIIDGVPCFWMKHSQAEVNYHPIFKYVWDEAENAYVCHRRTWYFNGHERVYEWKRGGAVELDVIVRMLNQYDYLANTAPMTVTDEYNML